MTASRGDESSPISVGGVTIAPGERRRLELPLARLPATQVFVSIPVEVVNGRKGGPRLWVSAAIHGDELNGVEIVRRVLEGLSPETLCGTVLAAPIVNAFGFINQSRYLPDRRDLNRSFPGSARGSLASRLAHLLMEEIVRKCSHGIDLHTGSDHRTNLPQVRANLRETRTRAFAVAFGAPLTIHAQTRDGSLRDAASRLGIPILLYEAGEALRFEAGAIDVGVRGILQAMSFLGMLEYDRPRSVDTVIATRTSWLRARTSGLLRLEVGLGDRVRRRQPLGVISDSFGELNVSVRSPGTGLVIGHTLNPLVRQGDGILHLAVDFEGERL